MLRSLLFVASLIAAAPLIAQSNAEVERRYSKEYVRCTDSPEGESTYGMLECIGNEHKKQDAALNATYKKVMARLKPARQKTLRQLQRDWIKRRDAIASESAAEWEGGTGASVAYTSSLLQETVRRTIWLERYR
jgi:uncharacterized protein YecT (DUF1311 family)